jgi:hypothetical protein
MPVAPMEPPLAPAPGGLKCGAVICEGFLLGSILGNKVSLCKYMLIFTRGGRKGFICSADFVQQFDVSSSLDTVHCKKGLPFSRP